jgi:hypothetical protein
MEVTSRDDIRRLLKTFGIQADEAIVAHLARAAPGPTLRLRLVLEDLTDYLGAPPPQHLHLEIEGEVRR